MRPLLAIVTLQSISDLAVVATLRCINEQIHGNSLGCMGIQVYLYCPNRFPTKKKTCVSVEHPAANPIYIHFPYVSACYKISPHIALLA